MSPAQTMKRAAQLLQEDAEEVKCCHTIDGQWDETRMDRLDRVAKASCDERMRVAAMLLVMAETYA